MENGIIEEVRTNRVALKPQPEVPETGAEK
jgi:hypothetical protein